MNKRSFKKFVSKNLFLLFSFVLYFFVCIAIDSDNGGGLYPWIGGVSIICFLGYAYLISKEKVNIDKAFKISLFSIVYFLVLLISVPVASPELRKQRMDAQNNPELAKEEKKGDGWGALIALSAIFSGIGYVVVKLYRSYRQASAEGLFDEDSSETEDESSSNDSLLEQILEASANGFKKGYKKTSNLSSKASKGSSIFPSSGTSLSSSQINKSADKKDDRRYAEFLVTWGGEGRIPVSYTEAFPVDMTHNQITKYMKKAHVMGDGSSLVSVKFVRYTTKDRVSRLAFEIYNH